MGRGGAMSFLSHEIADLIAGRDAYRRGDALDLTQSAAWQTGWLWQLS